MMIFFTDTSVSITYYIIMKHEDLLGLLAGETTEDINNVSG